MGKVVGGFGKHNPEGQSEESYERGVARKSVIQFLAEKPPAVSHRLFQILIERAQETPEEVELTGFYNRVVDFQKLLDEKTFEGFVKTKSKKFNDKKGILEEIEGVTDVTRQTAAENLFLAWENLYDAQVHILDMEGIDENHPERERKIQEATKKWDDRTKVFREQIMNIEQELRPVIAAYDRLDWQVKDKAKQYGLDGAFERLKSRIPSAKPNMERYVRDVEKLFSDIERHENEARVALPQPTEQPEEVPLTPEQEQKIVGEVRRLITQGKIKTLNRYCEVSEAIFWENGQSITTDNFEGNPAKLMKGKTRHGDHVLEEKSLSLGKLVVIGRIEHPRDPPFFYLVWKRE
ncbi:MAG: hypothetical protein WC730_01775 [Patescibacteria group bacterium]|jgi:hypothetical protein